MLTKIIRALFCSECECQNKAVPTVKSINRFEADHSLDTVEVFVETSRGGYTPLPRRPYIRPKPPGPE